MIYVGMGYLRPNFTNAALDKAFSGFITRSQAILLAGTKWLNTKFRNR